MNKGWKSSQHGSDNNSVTFLMSRLSLNLNCFFLIWFIYCKSFNKLSWLTLVQVDVLRPYNCFVNFASSWHNYCSLCMRMAMSFPRNVSWSDVFCHIQKPLQQYWARLNLGIIFWRGCNFAVNQRLKFGIILVWVQFSPLRNGLQ